MAAALHAERPSFNGSIAHGMIAEPGPEITLPANDKIACGPQGFLWNKYKSGTISSTHYTSNLKHIQDKERVPSAGSIIEICCI